MNEMLNKKDVLDAIEKKMKVVNEADGDADVVLGLAAAMSVVKKMEALKQEPKWIPVSERLPEFTINKLVVGTHFTEDVLVYDGADFRVGYFARKDKLDCNYWVVYGEDYFEPIAWMPIRPYKASPTGEEVEE